MQISRSIHSLLKNNRFGIGLIVASLVGAAGILFEMVNGVENIRAVIDWGSWIYERANTPWLGLFMLLLVGVMLWLGIRQVTKAAEQGDQLDQRRHEAEMQEAKRVLQAQQEMIKSIAQELEDSISLAQRFGFVLTMRDVYARLSESGKMIQNYKHEIERWSRGNENEWDTELGPDPLYDCLNRTMSTFSSLPHISNLPELFHPKFVFEADVSGSRFLKSYDAEVNEEYFLTHRKNFMRLMDFIKTNRTILEGKIRTIENESTMELKKFYAKSLPSKF